MLLEVASQQDVRLARAVSVVFQRENVRTGQVAFFRHEQPQCVVIFVATGCQLCVNSSTKARCSTDRSSPFVASAPIISVGASTSLA